MDAKTEIPATRGKAQAPFAVQAAKASVFAPFIAMAMNFMAIASQNGQKTPDTASLRIVVAFAACFLVLAGFALGVAALLKRNGHPGVRRWAIAGILLNLLIVASAVSLLFTLKDLHERQLLDRSGRPGQVAPPR